MSLARRIAKLEKIETMTRDNRLVLRFEGPGSEGLPQPTQEEIDGAAMVITVVLVAAKDGRPA